MTLYGILIAYAFIGCVYWLWMFVGTLRVVRTVPLLAQSDAPQPQTWPKLSIVIPACNEAASLESALRSVLEQDYPDLEIILIDDRSSDGTAAIVDRMAAADPRILAIHVEQLPEGWLGKVHALDLGAEKAGGSWLLFTDADVHMAAGHAPPRDGLCRASLDRPFGRRARSLAEFAAGRCQSWPCFAARSWSPCGLWAVADPKSDAFIGVGAFNLVRREALQHTAGFSWLRMEVGDDVGLGMMLKQSGARCCVVNAQEFARAALVSDFAGNGPRRGEGLRHGRPLQPGPGADAQHRAGGHGMGAAGWPWQSWRIPGLLWSGVAMLAAAVGSSVILARWSKSRLLPALLFPLAAIIAAGIMLRSGWLGYRRGGIVWRGTLYPKDQLLAGRRLKIP